DSLEVSEFGPEVVSRLRGENAALKEASEKASRRARELEDQLVQLAGEVKSLKEKIEAPANASPRASRRVSFGSWGEGREVGESSEATWKEAGQAAHEMSRLLKEQLEEGGELSPEREVQMAAENLKLAALAIKLNGKFPTHVTGNGEYTHPFVNWNVLA